MRKHLERLQGKLIAVAIVALAGWIYTTGNRVTALEAERPGIAKTLADIKEDVREIRRFLMGTTP